MGAMVRFKRESGRDVSELKQNDVSDLVLFMWCCVASASKADGVEMPYGFEEFADLLEPSGLTGFYEGIQEAEKKTTAHAGQ